MKDERFDPSVESGATWVDWCAVAFVIVVFVLLMVGLILRPDACWV